MTAEDVHHFRAIGRAAGGSVDYFGRLAEVRGPSRRGYASELLRIFVAKIVEAVHRAPRDALGGSERQWAPFQHPMLGASQGRY